MLLRVCALAVSALTAGASAQETGWERFFPMDPGNRWIVYDNPDRQWAYTDFAVVGDTVIDDQHFALIRTDWYNRHYRPTSAAHCAVRLIPCCDGQGAEIHSLLLSGGPDCLPPLLQGYNADLAGTGAPGTVQIGGATYGVEELLSVGHAIIMGGEGENLFAAGIGFVSGTWRSSQSSGGGATSSNLVYATVQSGTYGTEPVLFEPPDWRRLYPLEVGDRWVYGRSNAPFGPSNRWTQRTVIGDTTIAGNSYRIVHELTIPLSGPPTSESLCGVRLREDTGWFEWLSIQGTCTPYETTWPNLEFWRPLTDSMYVTPRDSFHVGGVSFPGVAAFEIGGDQGRYPPVYDHAVFLTDVGLYYWDYVHFSGNESWFLVHARVGGIEYGTNPVAAEPGPVPTAISLAARPNPFRADLQIEVASVGASELRLEVFDALGRRVHVAQLGVRLPGRYAIQIDGSNWAPGPYFVRIASRDGASATARLIRAR